jgi:putative DNA primase/helicase
MMSEISAVDNYRRQKINCVPIPKGCGKRLLIVGGWQRYQNEICTLPIPQDQDFSVILGKISDNLIVLDIDDCDDINEVLKILPDGLKITWIVRTGTGYHIYIKLSGDLPPNLYLHNGKYGLEVKSHGTYVIGASSEHYDKDEDGQQYKTGKIYTTISSTTDIAKLKADGKQIVAKLEELGWKPKASISLETGHVQTTPTSELEKGNWTPGERYGNGFKLALRRFHMGWEYEDVLNEAFRLNNTCNPAHNEAEVERWVSDAHTQFQKNKADPDNTYFKPKDEKDKKPSLDEIADAITNDFKFCTMYDNEEIVVYDEVKGVYIRDKGASVIKEECEKRVKACDNQTRNEIIGKIKAQTFVERTSFDSDPDVLTLDNCQVKISTLQTKQLSHNNLTFVKLPVSFQDTMPIKDEYTIDEIQEILKGTKFLEFIESCFTIEGKLLKDSVYNVLEMMASCFMKTPKLQKAFMNLGSGANGKSVMLSYLSHLLGKDNLSSESIHDLANSEFSPVGLYGKLANIVADIEHDELKHTGTLKKVIAGDSIKGNQKYQKAFNFVAYAKCIFSCNRMPKTVDQSDGWFRRWVIINWPKQFTGAEIDPDMLSKLTSNEDEKNLVANLLLRMARNLNNRGRILHAPNWGQTKRTWNDAADHVMQFEKQMCTAVEGENTTKRKMYETYKEWCYAKEYDPLTIKQFGESFSQFYDDHQEKVEGLNQRVWLDVDVKNMYKQEGLDESET